MTQLDYIQPTQASKEVTANAALEALSPSAAFARRAAGCVALTWAYYGADILIDGVQTTIPSGTLQLDPSTTCYIEADRAGVVSVNTAGFTPGRFPLYQATTGAESVTAYTDLRTPGRARGYAVVAMADADKTLTAAQARCETVATTGALTAQRAVAVPAVPAQYTIRNQCTGFGVLVKTPSGAGVVVGAGKVAVVECDGVDVYRVTADA